MSEQVEKFLEESTKFNRFELSRRFRVNERTIRKIIAEMGARNYDRKIFIADKNETGGYILACNSTKNQVNDYYRTWVKFCKSVYFDRLLPIASFLDTQHKDSIYAVLDLFSDIEQSLDELDDLQKQTERHTEKGV